MKNRIFIDEVFRAKNLNSLKTLLETKKYKNENELQLPVFSKNRPGNLNNTNCCDEDRDIYSYDNNHVLVKDQSCNVWKIEQRCKVCREAMYNCCC